MKTFVSLCIGGSLLLTGCRQSAVTDEVVVRVNGDPITHIQVVEEADNRINANKVRDAAKGLMFEESARDMARDMLREEVVSTLIERRLIAQQLKTDGLQVTDAEVDACLLEKAKGYGQTLQEAERQIQEQGKTVRAVKERLRWHTLGVEKLYLAHASDKKVLTEAEALKIYTEYPGEFDVEERRRVSHILIRAAPGDAEAVKSAARSKAAGLLQRIRAGEDFARLAEANSDDDLSKMRGGDRGYSGRGIIRSPTDDPFGNVAFAMKNIGEISDVVETQDGYHIIKLTDVQEARRKSFDEVKNQLIWDFKYREIGVFWEQFGGDLRAKAKIELTPSEQERRVAARKRQEELNERIEAEVAREQAKAREQERVKEQQEKELHSVSQASPESRSNSGQP